jgi:HEXXH motif-containing protein
LLKGFPFLAVEAGEADARRLIMIRGLAVYPDFRERLDRPESRINWLPALLEAQPAERAVSAVPFFWFHLKQAFTALASDSPKAALDLALDHVAWAALDSFAGETDGFPSNFFSLPIASGAQMMRMGLSFSPKRCPQSARALSGALAFAVDGGEFRVSAPSRPRGQIQAIPVRRMESALVDIGSSADRLETDEDAIQKLRHDLDRSTEWIAEVSPICANLMSDEIQFFVPLRQGESAHYSFTLSHVPGLLFVGGSPRLLTVVEALIHEAGHARLHHANEVHPLVPQGQSESFYSPWRADPRPSSGVLHGFYVFALVLLFWIDVLESRGAPLTGEEEKYIRSRVALISVQLREAASVLEQAQLTGFGETVLEAVRQVLPAPTSLPILAAELGTANERSALKRSRASADFPALTMPRI